jgi:hypothetical protein
MLCAQRSFSAYWVQFDDGKTSHLLYMYHQKSTSDKFWRKSIVNNWFVVYSYLKKKKWKIHHFIGETFKCLTVKFFDHNIVLYIYLFLCRFFVSHHLSGVSKLFTFQTSSQKRFMNYLKENLIETKMYMNYMYHWRPLL